MEDADSRRFVKNEASEIQKLIKDINRKRIDMAKQAKSDIDSEAKIIVDRLEKANEPYTLLINEHNAERARILAEEKAIIEAKESAIKVQLDHEEAINLNKLFEFERADREGKAIELAKQAETDAIEKAKAKLQYEQDLELKQKEQELALRKANQEYVTSVCRASKESLMQHVGLSEEDAVKVVKAIRSELITNITINI